MLRSRSIMAAVTTAAMGLIAYQSYSFVREWYEPKGEPLRAAGEATPAGEIQLRCTTASGAAGYFVSPLLHQRMARRQFRCSKCDAKGVPLISWRQAGSSFWRYLETHFKEVISGPQFTIFDLIPFLHQSELTI
jgi:hypothetical protein